MATPPICAHGNVHILSDTPDLVLCDVSTYISTWFLWVLSEGERRQGEGRSNLCSIYLVGEAKTFRSSGNCYIANLHCELIYTVINMATILGCIVSLLEVNASISSVHQHDSIVK